MVEATPSKQKVLDIYLMLNCKDCAACRILLLTYLVMIIDKMVQHYSPIHLGGNADHVKGNLLQFVLI